MRRITAALLGALAGALVAATPSQTPVVLVDGNQRSAADEVERAFEDFIQRFRKNYTAAEREVRFAAFKENFNNINEHNRGNHSYVVGINVFADLTHEEFSRTYLASNSTLLMQSPYQGAAYLGVHAPDNLTTLPKKVDWVADGAVTAVKNQGHCGGCWAFSATGALEGAWKIATQHLVSLSEQQIIDCSYQSEAIFQGCRGGNPIVAFEWLRDRALCNEASYQFVDGDSFDGTYSCSRSCRITIASGGVSGFKIVTSQSEKALMHAVADHGPVSVALEADQLAFQFYHGGVLSSPACFAKRMVDHAVLVVGYGTDSDGGDYWMVKNSWGPTWGENGYIRIARGGGSSGVCGILTQPAYPVVDGSKAVPADSMLSIILGASFLGCCCLCCLYCGLRQSSCCRRRPVQRAPLLAGPPPSGGARTIVAPQQPRAQAFSVPPQAAAVPAVSASQVRTGNSAGSRLLQQQQQQQMQQLQNARSGGQARVQPSANQALRNP